VVNDGISGIEEQQLKTIELLNKIDKRRIWDDEPVFCFTSDIDWASEAALEMFLSDICEHDLRITLFVTHESRVVNQHKKKGLVERGIHPNFLENSSHGKGFRTVIECCVKIAPEAEGFRSHRLFDVTNVTHLLHDEYGFKYDSNLATIMQPKIRPILHESGLIRFPIFFEDGTHLFNKLSLSMSDYSSRFLSPGIKIISVHPMNCMTNAPEIRYMRQLKDSLSREEYSRISSEQIKAHRYNGVGITDLVNEIISLAKGHTILSLSQLYELAIS